MKINNDNDAGEWHTNMQPQTFAVVRKLNYSSL